MHTDSDQEITNIFGGPAPRAAGDQSTAPEVDQQPPPQRALPRASRGLRQVGLVCLAAALVVFGGMVGARLGSRAPTSPTPPARPRPSVLYLPERSHPAAVTARAPHHGPARRPSRRRTARPVTSAAVPSPPQAPLPPVPPPAEPSTPAGPTGPGEFF
jgi:hypothetical protein